MYAVNPRYSTPFRFLFYSCVFLGVYELLLVIDRPSVFARRAFVKHRLALVDAPQLDGVVSDLRMAAFHAGFFDRCPRGFLVSPQGRLFRVRFCPQGGRSRRRVRHRVRDLCRNEIGEVRRVRAHVAIDRTGSVDLQGGPARRTKRPGHFASV